MISQANSDASADYYSRGSESATTNNSPATTRDNSPVATPAATPAASPAPSSATSSADQSPRAISAASNKEEQKKTMAKKTASSQKIPRTKSTASSRQPSVAKISSKARSASPASSTTGSTSSSTSNIEVKTGSGSRQRSSPLNEEARYTVKRNRTVASRSSSVGDDASLASIGKKGSRKARSRKRSSRASSAASTPSRAGSRINRRASRADSSSSSAPSLASFHPGGKKPRVSRRRGNKQLKDKSVHLHANGAPKKPPTSYGLFLHKLRQMKPRKKMTFESFNEMARKKWRGLSEAHKDIFRERAEGLQKEYMRAKQSYQRSKLKRLRKDLGSAVVSPSPKGRRGKRKIDRRRRSGKTNSFMLFTKEKRSEVTAEMPHKSTVAQIAKELGKRWKSLSESERQSYKERAKKEAEKADKRMAQRLKKGKDPYVRKDREIE